MKTGRLYIKAEQNIEVVNPKVTVEDVVKLYSMDSELVKTVGKLVVFHVKAIEDTNYMVSIMKIIELISKEYPEVDILNEGETDFVVTYKIPKKKPRYMEYIKVILISFTAFFGAAFSIMTFNEDSSVKDIFNQVYVLIMGQEKTGVSWIDIAYCIGLPVGIIVFYNHFAGFRIQKDPTPIQTQMRLYEEDVNKTLIQNASREGNTIDSN